MNFFKHFLQTLLIISTIVPISMALVGCGTHKSTSTDNPLGQVQAKGTFYTNNLSSAIYTERCDKLTFEGLLSVEVTQEIEIFQSSPGKWNRDTKPCYPDYSASEISNEGIVSVLHALWSTQNCALISDLYDYGIKNNWIMGAGDKEDTNATVLFPTILKEKDLICKTSSLTTIESDLDAVLSGYRGHILASWIWLVGRMDGTINGLEKAALDDLVGSSPQDPYYLALNSRFGNGDQTLAIEGLINDTEFPSTVFPLEDSVFGWGSAPASVYYLITQAVLEGK